MIHTIAQFLTLNSEAIKSNYLNGKMPLIYFFFHYAKTYGKDYYDNFAFDVLESILHDELSEVENKESTHFGTIGIGYSLMKFIENDFFESDDLNEILLIVDKIAFYEVNRLSRTEYVPGHIHQMIELGNYLNERIAFLKEAEEHYLAVKEHLLIIFFELSQNITVLREKDYRLGISCKNLFENSLNNGIIKHFSEQGLRHLSSLRGFDHEKISKDYILSLKSKDLGTALLYELLYSEEIDSLSQNSEALRREIETSVNDLMDDLYSKKTESEKQLVLKLVVPAIFTMEGSIPILQKRKYLLSVIDNLENYGHHN